MKTLAWPERVQNWFQLPVVTGSFMTMNMAE